MIEMTAQQLRERLNNDEPTPLLLDVREPSEFEYCHIENSVLIPMGDIVHQHTELDVEQEIVVICHHGIRSRQVAFYLEQQNFSKVLNLTGGVEAWAESVEPTMSRY